MRKSVVVALLAVAACSVSWPGHAQPTPAALEVITAGGLTLEPQVEWERARLVAGGPDGYRIERAYRASDAIVFHGLDATGSPLADGFYRYEVFFFVGSERVGVIRGSVSVDSGQVTLRGPRGEPIGKELNDAPSVEGRPIEPRDIIDDGDIKAGGGLASGDTTLDPLDGELELEFLGDISAVVRHNNGLLLEALDGTSNGAIVFLGDDDNVGIDTMLPNAPLHVLGGPGGNVAIVEGGALAVHRFDGISANIRFRASGQTWLFQNQPTDGTFNIRDQTGSVTPVRVFPGGQGATLVVRNGRLGLRKTTPQHPIHAFNGARLTSGGVWADASSRESKQDIESLSTEEALATLEALDPVKFAYKVDATDRHVGFIAEDVPDLVATPDRKALAAMDVVAVLTKVVQEQERRDERQRQLIEEQQAQIAELRELLVAQQAGAGGAQ